MSLTRVGGDLLKQPLNIGTGVTITPDGNASFSGIVTAANLVGSDGRPIVSGAGLGTAVVAGSDEGGEQIYYTNTVLNITDNLTIDPPDSANTSYTQYQEVAVEQGKDLIVEDDFIVDVLGISSSVVTPLPGQGGRVRADRFTNKAGTGAPEFPNGVTISAGSTVTGDFGVSGDLLVGNDLTVSGSKTYLNTNSVEFKDKNIGIASVSTGKLTDGQLNGAGFTIYGLNGDKSLTWDNPNDRMAFSTDLYAPRMYADSVAASNSITVGDTFLKSQSVGLGATTNSGRNAGINTAIGTLIYNSTTGNVEVYDGTRWKSSSVDGQYIQATGGTSVDYFSDGVKYRVHTFTSSDTFDVSYVSPLNNTVEYLVVGAGGGGGHSNIDGTQSSGGGAGGFRTGIGFVVNSSPGSYTVTIGAGGGTQSSGTNSVFDTITSLGGGYGGAGGGAPGGPGGSAGGQGGSGGAFTRNITAGTPGQGNPGGHGTGPGGDAGGGGGGAGTAGGNAVGATAGTGGLGLYSSITGSSVGYAGGGGNNPGPNGFGGGFNGSDFNRRGETNTGGGGKGTSGSGGSGIVAIRYQIGQQSLKATGGTVSYSSDKTIHTFTSSASFTVTDPTLTSVDYLVVAGGGGGGVDYYQARSAGGGGAGGFRTGTGLPVNTASTYTVTVGGGGVGGVMNQSPAVAGVNGGDSIFSTITSTGGGGGAGHHDIGNIGAGDGGSGGGSTHDNTAGPYGLGNTPPTSPPQGNPGGSAGNTVGGAGSASSISGASVTYAGGGGAARSPNPYAGGGGGGASQSGQPGSSGAGGAGGGGSAGNATSGNDVSAGTPGSQNLGGGGGASRWTSGGNGGSGIVIISYPT